MKHHLKHVLKTHGLKATPAREHILDVFSRDCKPVNADYIIESIKDKVIDEVTIYRTLKSFEEKMIIKRVDLRKESVYYELSHNHHHHIVCTNCGTTESFDGCSIKPIVKKALGKSVKFKNINEHSFELFGICRMCSVR